MHPCITLPPAAAVVDVATGSALWLADVARAMPDASLLGLDIDLSQAPTARWLPGNARLEKWDLFSEPPEALHGAFDLVHLRLLVTFLPADEILALLRRVRTLLKPGGLVQWDELDP